MKSHMLCASQASTAICLSMDRIDKTVTGAGERGGRIIDRHNPIIRDSRRSFGSTFCSSVDVPKPPPYRQLQWTKMPSPGEDDASSRKLRKSQKSFVDGGGAAALLKLIAEDIGIARRRRRSFSCARPAGDFFKTPQGSSRYLLADGPDSLSGSSDLIPIGTKYETSESKKGSHVLEDNKKDSDSSSVSVSEKKASLNQVVVALRVSLHCKGCEGKVRKHLSRMQGVTSFSIDFAAKKVTVIGDVTPLEVLASISKVKNAQFWTPQPQHPPSQQSM